MGTLQEILHNPYFVSCAMAVIIFAVTQGLKQFIKLGTKHIKNERARKIVNATILLIPFGLGILFEYLFATYYLHSAFSLIKGLVYGSAGISLYGVIERFFKVKVNNPYNTEEGKAVTDLVDKVVEDGKVDSSDMSAVQEFLDKVSK